MTDQPTTLSVAAILVSYNSDADLAEALPRLVDPRIEVIVVDNASDDYSAAVAKVVGATVIALPDNVGWAAGCNVGARHTEADVLVFVNPDARPTADDLLRLAEGLREPGVGMTAPRFVDFAGAPQSFYVRFPTPWSGMFCFFSPGPRIDGGRHLTHRHYDHQAPDMVDQPGAACVAVMAKDFEQLGGYAESFFLFFADTDFCRRMADGGQHAVINWDITVPHRQGGSVNRLGALRLQQHVQRDYLVYARLHYGLAGRLLTLWAYVLLGGVIPALAKLARGRLREARLVLTLMLADLRPVRAGKPA